MNPKQSFATIWSPRPREAQTTGMRAGMSLILTLTKFTNIFRAEVGKDQYTDAAQREAALSFLEMLQKQSDDFVEESRGAMRAAGFAKTPWDNWERKTPRTP